MRIHVRYGHWVPRALRVGGITLYPYVLIARRDPESARTTLSHELVHVEQVGRLGVARFYATYLLEYARGLARTRRHRRAYREISFEREAYERERG